MRGQNLNSGRRTYLQHSEYVAIFSRMLIELGYVGTCCINYKMERGVPKLLEINPRVGSSLIPDINRYLFAYLRSLGAVDVFTPGFRRPQSLGSYLPYRAWQLLSTTRRASKDLWMPAEV